MAVQSVEIVLNGVDNATPVMDKVTQKLVDNENKYISKLKEQLIAQTQGAEAAERFKLAEMGFSEEAINTAMALKQQLEAAKAAKAETEALAQAMDETADASKASNKATISASDGLRDLASAVGLPQLGNLVSQFQQLREVSRSAGGGVKFAQAAIAATVVVASFEVGKMIADWIYQTEAWANKMRETLEGISRQAAFQNERSRERFQIQIDTANAAATEEQRLAELEALRATKNEEERKAEAAYRKAKKEQERALANDTFGYGKEDNDVAAEGVRIAEERLRLAREQGEQVRREIQGPSESEQELARRKQHHEEIKEQQEQIANFTQQQADEAARLAQEGETAEQRRQREVDHLQTMMFSMQHLTALDIERARQALATRHEAEREAEARAAIAQQQQTDESYLQALREQNMALRQGEQALADYRAAQAGVSQAAIEEGQAIKIQNELLETRKQLADEEKKADKERQKALAGPTAILQANQSRLLTRVSTGGGDRVAKASERTAELTEKIERLQREQLELQQRRGVTELAVVEG